MRGIAIALSAALLAACAKKDDAPSADSAAISPPAAPAAMNLADVAGKWQVDVAPADRDTTLLTYELNTTADTTGWTLTFAGREPLALRVLAVDGDSVVTEVGPYESALRPGVQVTTRSVSRLRGDRLVGTATAHYVTTSADSVVQLRTRGRRAQ